MSTPLVFKLKEKNHHANPNSKDFKRVTISLEIVHKPGTSLEPS